MMRSVLLLSCALSAVCGADDYQSSDGTAGLGVRTGPVPLDVQAANGLAPGEGTMVRRVIPWAPAGTIGLQRGDVIVAVDGVPTDSRRDLRQEVWANSPGTDFELTVLRDGEQLTFTGEYGRIPDFIVERLHLPSEHWEDHVEQRQRELLADMASNLDTAQAAVQRHQAETAAAAGLPPLRYDQDTGKTGAKFGDKDARVVLGLSAAPSPWSFSFHWSHVAARPQDTEL
ncbi:MAG: PDZ domain-containing protein [Planctomycetota bacterium]|jgi:C-terminal processing protease CtpA/Prc|nr:PDZ domain-containing protein [Planctomycetota bacterium]